VPARYAAAHVTHDHPSRVDRCLRFLYAITDDADHYDDDTDHDCRHRADDPRAQT
jgi:hypothetical protein